MPCWQGTWSQESELLSAPPVGLDMLEEVVELVSGTMGASKISIGASGLDAEVSFVVGETHWLGLSLSGDKVSVVQMLCCFVGTSVSGGMVMYGC